MKNYFSTYRLLAAAVLLALGAFLVLAGHNPAHAGMTLLALQAPMQGDWLAGLAFGGLTITPANLALLKQGFNAAFKAAFGSAKPMWEKIAMKVPSTTGEEVYGWLGANTKMREWVTNLTKLRVEADIDSTGQIKDQCDTPLGRTMTQMRDTYSSHDHDENNVAGSPTNGPNQPV